MQHDLDKAARQDLAGTVIEIDLDEKGSGFRIQLTACPTHGSLKSYFRSRDVPDLSPITNQHRACGLLIGVNIDS